MNLGVHVSAAGNVYEAVDRAFALGCTTMQFFSRNPQQWKPVVIDSADAQEFRRRRRLRSISPVFIHVPYLINLASPEERLYEASIDAYVQDIIEAAKLGVEFIVTHMGSRKEAPERDGLRRLADAVREILKRTRSCPTAILLENTAGSGTSLGYTFEHHAQVIGRAKGSPRVGVCLDTAHAYGAGFDLAGPAGLKRLLAEIKKTVGLDRLKLVHLNDTAAGLGSRVDRHEHIGKGNIGIAGMRRIVTSSALRNVPFVLETPKDSDDADPRNLALVRSLRSGRGGRAIAHRLRCAQRSDHG